MTEYIQCEKVDLPPSQNNEKRKKNKNVFVLCLALGVQESDLALGETEAPNIYIGSLWKK